MLLPDPRVTSLLPYFCTPQLDKDSPGQAEAMRTELLQLIDEIFSTPSPLVNYLESKNLNYRLRHAIVKDPLRLHLLLRCCYDHSLVCLTAAAATTTPERWGPPSLEGKAQLCLEWLKRNADFITTLSLTKGEQIYCIPEEIFELPNLTSLCIVFQRVRTLFPSLGSARKLTSLVLSYNRITALPGAIEGLAALQELRLDGNRFSSVPTQGLPPNLAFLDLSENPLETIPMTLGRMTRQHFPGRIVYT